LTDCKDLAYLNKFAGLVSKDVAEWIVSFS